MAQVIPINSEGSRRVTVPLGDEIGPITFRTRYVPSVPLWYLDLFSANGDPLIYGLALVPPHNLLRHQPVLVRTIGDLRVIDLDGNGNVDGDRLGTGVGLVHYAPGEFEALYPNFDTPPLPPLSYDLDELFTVST
jgi:hypothetical protein